jgi:hypothetical protein
MLYNASLQLIFQKMKISTICPATFARSTNIGTINQGSVNKMIVQVSKKSTRFLIHTSRDKLLAPKVNANSLSLEQAPNMTNK